MKKFKFYFTKLIVFLLVLATIIPLFSLGIDVYYIIFTPPFESVFKYIILGILSLVLAILSFSLLFSNYKITKEHVILSVGLLRIKFEVNKIVQITIFNKTNALVVYFSDAKFARILIKKSLFDEFVKELREQNSLIIYSTTEKE